MLKYDVYILLHISIKTTTYWDKICLKVQILDRRAVTGVGRSLKR